MSTTLSVRRAGDLEIQPPENQWLIEELWGRAAIGLIGGPPKCCKTWFGLDMALSVASGTDALGIFATHDPGPALIYLAEDALSQVRARIESLCRHRRIDINRLDLHVITEPTIRLDLRADQERLCATVEEFKPRLLLLDPLVRMHRLDENSAADISGLLSYVRELQRRFDLAIILVHHASKKQRAQPGQALRGSSDLHAIGDSNLYLSRKGDQLSLTIEHRAARSHDPILVELATDDEQDAVHLRVCSDVPSKAERQADSLEQKILHLLSQSIPLSRTAIRQRLRVNNARLGDALTCLKESGHVDHSKRGWKLPGETQAGSAEVQPAQG